VPRSRLREALTQLRKSGASQGEKDGKDRSPILQWFETPLDDHVPWLFDYVQVSPPGTTFGRELKVPEVRAHVPFATPRGFTDGEIVGIVDHIHSAERETLPMRYIVRGTEQTYPGAPSLPQRSRIMRVGTGDVVAPLVGLGTDYWLFRTATGFLVLNKRSWIS